MAFPASVPGCHTSRIASRFLFSQGSVKGRPLKSTSTIGFPVLASAFNKSRCVSGILISERLADSPDMFADSPAATTTTSAFFAVSTASSICSCADRLSLICFIPKNQARESSSESSVKLEPCAYNIFASGATFLIPCITLTDLEGSPATTQVPSISE